MTLAVAVYVPEGIVLASDSRQFITLQGKTPEGQDFKIETISSDAVIKTFLLEKHNVGISTFGQDLLGGIHMANYIKRFREEVLHDIDSVEEIASGFLKFMNNQFPTVDTGFHIAGYKREGKVTIPYVYHCNLRKNELIRQNYSQNKIVYGALWSGQGDVVAGLISPVMTQEIDGRQKVVKQPIPIIWEAMTLQDAIDFALFAIRTTIDTIRFQARQKNVGGPIDVLVITPTQSEWIIQKKLNGGC